MTLSCQIGIKLVSTRVPSEVLTWLTSEWSQGSLLMDFFSVWPHHLPAPRIRASLWVSQLFAQGLLKGLPKPSRPTYWIPENGISDPVTTGCNLEETGVAFCLSINFYPWQISHVAKESQCCLLSDHPGALKDPLLFFPIRVVTFP